MNELNNLELREIAEQNKTNIQQIIDRLIEARVSHDGPSIAGAIDELETIYKELAPLDDAEKRAARDKGLEVTRKRFGLGLLQENAELSTLGWTALGRVTYHLDRAMEGLNRWLVKLQDGQDFEEDILFSIDRTGEAVNWAYLICRPLEREAVAR